jgi:GDP-L-fucose synthase
MREESLLTGPLEPTNEAYAVAKIAGIKMCEGYRRQYGADFRSVMPTNLYGPGDNFDDSSSHVVPALMRKFRLALERGAHAVEIWGSGTPRREFLHVDDMAAACVFVMEKGEEQFWSSVDERCAHLNVGTGEDISILALAGLLKSITGFQGELIFDADKPDGTPRKLLNVDKLTKLGWQASIKLEAGLSETWQWLLAHPESARSLAD